jgi:hypothetical protein
MRGDAEFFDPMSSTEEQTEVGLFLGHLWHHVSANGRQITHHHRSQRESSSAGSSRRSPSLTR